MVFLCNIRNHFLLLYVGSWYLIWESDEALTFACFGALRAMGLVLNIWYEYLFVGTNNPEDYNQKNVLRFNSYQLFLSNGNENLWTPTTWI